MRYRSGRLLRERGELALLEERAGMWIALPRDEGGDWLSISGGNANTAGDYTRQLSRDGGKAVSGVFCRY